MKSSTMKSMSPVLHSESNSRREEAKSVLRKDISKKDEERATFTMNREKVATLENSVAKDVIGKERPNDPIIKDKSPREIGPRNNSVPVKGLGSDKFRKNGVGNFVPKSVPLSPSNEVKPKNITLKEKMPINENSPVRKNNIESSDGKLTIPDDSRSFRQDTNNEVYKNRQGNSPVANTKEKIGQKPSENEDNHDEQTKLMEHVSNAESECATLIYQGSECLSDSKVNDSSSDDTDAHDPLSHKKKCSGAPEDTKRSRQGEQRGDMSTKRSSTMENQKGKDFHRDDCHKTTGAMKKRFRNNDSLQGLAEVHHQNTQKVNDWVTANANLFRNPVAFDTTRDASISQRADFVQSPDVEIVKVVTIKSKCNIPREVHRFTQKTESASDGVIIEQSCVSSYHPAAKAPCSGEQENPWHGGNSASRGKRRNPLYDVPQRGSPGCQPIAAESHGPEDEPMSEETPPTRHRKTPTCQQRVEPRNGRRIPDGNSQRERCSCSPVVADTTPQERCNGCYRCSSGKNSTNRPLEDLFQSLGKRTSNACLERNWEEAFRTRLETQRRDIPLKIEEALQFVAGRLLYSLHVMRRRLGCLTGISKLPPEIKDYVKFENEAAAQKVLPEVGDAIRVLKEYFHYDEIAFGILTSEMMRDTSLTESEIEDFLFHVYPEALRKENFRDSTQSNSRCVPSGRNEGYTCRDQDSPGRFRTSAESFSNRNSGPSPSGSSAIVCEKGHVNCGREERSPASGQKDGRRGTSPGTSATVTSLLRPCSVASSSSPMDTRQTPPQQQTPNAQQQTPVINIHLYSQSNPPVATPSPHNRSLPRGSHRHRYSPAQALPWADACLCAAQQPLTWSPQPQYLDTAAVVGSYMNTFGLQQQRRFQGQVCPCHPVAPQTSPQVRLQETSPQTPQATPPPAHPRADPPARNK